MEIWKISFWGAGPESISHTTLRCHFPRLGTCILRAPAGKSALTPSSKYWWYHPAKTESSRKDCWLHPTGTWGALFFWRNYKLTLRWSLNWVALEQGPTFPPSHRLGRHHPQGKTPMLGSQAAGSCVARGRHAFAPFSRSCATHNTELPWLAFPNSAGHWPAKHSSAGGRKHNSESGHLAWPLLSLLLGSLVVCCWAKWRQAAHSLPWHSWCYPQKGFLDLYALF